VSSGAENLSRGLAAEVQYDLFKLFSETIPDSRILRFPVHINVHLYANKKF
jgi:hypothetical protein